MTDYFKTCSTSRSKESEDRSRNWFIAKTFDTAAVWNKKEDGENVNTRQISV